MTKSEFQELQNRVATCGTTIKDFLRREGVAYSTYKCWRKKLKAEAEAEAEPMPIAAISIHRSAEPMQESARMCGVEMPGVTQAFANGVKAHFGRGSESVLPGVLSQSISGHVLP